MSNVLYRTIMAGVAAVMFPVYVLAQTENRAPAGAVFGGAAAGKERQILSLTINLDQAYDQNVMVRSGADALSLFEGSGLYTMLTPTLDFSSHGDRLQVVATAGSNARYYSDAHEVLVTNQSAGAGLTMSLGTGTTVAMNQGVSRSRALLSGLLASAATPVMGGVVSPVSDYALKTNDSVASVTAASLTSQLTARTAVTFTSNLQFTKSDQRSNYPDLESRSGGGVFSRSMSRRTKLKLGYTFRQAQYEGTPRSTEHDLNIGLDYSVPLSRTRRAEVSFTLGPAVVTAPLTIASTDLLRQYRLIADAAVRYPLRRTWDIQGSYHRGMGYIQGFETPVFTGAYAASVNGFLTRRADLSLSAAYSSGEAALTGTASQFTTYTGDARLRFALNRTWAAYVEYLLYYYDFDRDFSFAVGLPPGVTRNGLRTGVTLWLPMRHK